MRRAPTWSEGAPERVQGWPQILTAHLRLRSASPSLRRRRGSCSRRCARAFLRRLRLVIAGAAAQRGCERGGDRGDLASHQREEVRVIEQALAQGAIVEHTSEGDDSPWLSYKRERLTVDSPAKRPQWRHAMQGSLAAARAGRRRYSQKTEARGRFRHLGLDERDDAARRANSPRPEQ